MSSISNCFDFIYRVWLRIKLPNTLDQHSQLNPHEEIIPIEFRINKVHGVQEFTCVDDDDPVSSSLEVPLHPATVSVFEDAGALLRDGGIRLRSVPRTMNVEHECVNRISLDILKATQFRFAGDPLLSSILVSLVPILAFMTPGFHEESEYDEPEPEPDTETEDEPEGDPEYDSEDFEMDMVAATKSSIEALEKVFLEEGGLEKYCTICMEEYEGGMEATRLPCSHLFHGYCIVRWLLKSHLCPLCRFPMPPSSLTCY